MLKIIETLYTQVAIAKLEFFEAITKLFSLEVAITYLLALFTFHAYASTTAKPARGKTKGSTGLPPSAIRPISKKPHPPTGVIISTDEALLVRTPKSLRAKEKMVGNIMASKK